MNSGHKNKFLSVASCICVALFYAAMLIVLLFKIFVFLHLVRIEIRLITYRNVLLSVDLGIFWGGLLLTGVLVMLGIVFDYVCWHFALGPRGLRVNR